MKVANRTSLKLDEYKVSLGELMYTILYRKIEFYKTFNRRKNVFKDLDKLESKVIWLNIVEAAHLILQKLEEMFQSENKLQAVLLTYATIEAVTFITLSLLLGLFFFLIFLRVENIRRKIEKFFLKMDRKLLAKELIRLHHLNNEGKSILTQQMGMIWLSEEEEKKIEVLFRKNRNNLVSSRRGKQNTNSTKLPSKINLVDIKYNFSRFSQRPKSGKLKIAIMAISIVLMINLPLIFNYNHFVNVSNTIQELSYLRQQNKLRIASNNIGFAIALFKYLRLHQFSRNPLKYPSPEVYDSILKLEKRLDPYLTINYYKQNERIFNKNGLDFVLTRDFCTPTIRPLKMNARACRYVTNNNKDANFLTGFNQMITYYSQLKSNEGNLDLIDSKYIWINENIANYVVIN